MYNIWALRGSLVMYRCCCCCTTTVLRGRFRNSEVWIGIVSLCVQDGTPTYAHTDAPFVDVTKRLNYGYVLLYHGCHKVNSSLSNKGTQQQQIAYSKNEIEKS